MSVADAAINHPIRLGDGKSSSPALAGRAHSPLINLEPLYSHVHHKTQAAAPEQRAHVIRPFVSSVPLISTSSLPRFCPFPLLFPSAAGIKGCV